MSPKAKAKAAVKKMASKAAPKTAKAAPKADKKGGKAAAKAETKGAAPAAPVPGEEGVDLDELEEQQDAAAAASKSGADAALAAASGSSEMSASFKSFRHHPDMENFYRFIYENDLRYEALTILDKIIGEKRDRKAVKGGKSAH